MQTVRRHRTSDICDTGRCGRSGCLCFHALLKSHPVSTRFVFLLSNLVLSPLTKMASYKLLRGPPAAALGSFALASLGLAVYRKSIFAEAHAEARDPQPQDARGLAGTPELLRPAPPKIFSSGPSMVSLRLKSSEEINHNTKLLRFEFPNPEAVSGLSLTCKRSESVKTGHILTLLQPPC